MASSAGTEGRDVGALSPGASRRVTGQGECVHFTKAETSEKPVSVHGPLGDAHGVQQQPQLTATGSAEQGGTASATRMAPSHAGSVAEQPPVTPRQAQLGQARGDHHGPGQGVIGAAVTAGDMLNQCIFPLL